MVQVSIEGDRAIFSVEGLHKMWAFRSRLEIPLAHITGVEVNQDQVGRWWHGIRVIGTELPGVFAAGTFRYQGGLAFWDVRNPANTIIVSLADEHYKKLIIEVADPQMAAGMLRAAIPSS